MTTLLHNILLMGQVPWTLADIYPLSIYSQCVQDAMAAPVEIILKCSFFADVTNQTICFCSDRDFLNASAVAIYQQCGCIELEAASHLLALDCAHYGTSCVLSGSDFVKAGCGSITCSSSPAISPKEIAGIVSGVIAVIVLALGFLQLAACLKWIPENWAPLRYIQSLCCCCCYRGSRRNHHEKPQPDPSQDELPMYDLDPPPYTP
jgi:hypothetical protein